MLYIFSIKINLTSTHTLLLNSNLTNRPTSLQERMVALTDAESSCTKGHRMLNVPFVSFTTLNSTDVPSWCVKIASKEAQEEDSVVVVVVTVTLVEKVAELSSS